MNITIIGLGVIGGSYAGVLKSLGHNVSGVDVSSDTIKKAINLKIIDDGATYTSNNFENIIKTTDLLVLCIYPNDIKKFILDYKTYFKNTLVITDVSGIKKHLGDTVHLLPLGVDFIFAHPMAGREKRGIDFSSTKIFKNANFIITPIDFNKPCNILLIENLAYDMGFKSVKKITPEEHDLIISFISQLPHAIAVALINSDNLGVNTGKFTGDSYRELTRIANINEDLWSELFICNKENLINRIDEFQKELNMLRHCLISNDDKTLKEMFIKSSKRREALDS